MKWLNWSANWLLSSPLVWGGVMSVAFHAALSRTPKWIDPWLLRRLTGPWESYVFTTMFLIAIAFLAKRAIELGFHTLVLRRFALGRVETTAAAEIDPESLITALEAHPWAKRSSFYYRLRDAWAFHIRPGNPGSLSLHLKDLSDAELDRLHVRYGMMRLLIWTIPSCGCVATILSIARVVEQLTPSDTSNVLSGMSETFNTFGFAIGLAILLFVLKSVFEQAEQLMLAAIDRQVTRAMSGYLDERVDVADTQSDQLRQLTETMDSMARSLAQQTDLVRRVQSNLHSPGTSSPSGVGAKDIETVVQRAVVSAFQRQPSAAMTNEPTAVDSAGWKTLQQLLQRLAAVLEQQNAKLETDGRVSKQLSAIIDEGLEDTPAPLANERGSQHRRDVAAILGR